MTNKFLFTIGGFHLLVLAVPVAAFVLLKFARAWHHMLALFTGLLIGYINIQTAEVIFPALLLIAFGFFLGFSRQDGAWQLAMLLAMWIPIGSFIQIVVEGRTQAIVQEGCFSFVAFIPAFIGTYAGVALRRTGTSFDAKNA